MAIDVESDALDLVRELGLDEQIVYVPNGGRRRTIYAVVEREQVTGVDGAPVGVRTQGKTVTVVNDATTGISRDELDRGEDKIEVADEVGGDLVERPIVDLVTEDQGLLTVRVN